MKQIEKGEGGRLGKRGLAPKAPSSLSVDHAGPCYPLPMACYPTWAALLKDWILDKTYGTLERACNRAAVLQNVKIPASVVFLGNQPIPTYAVVSPRR